MSPLSSFSAGLHCPDDGHLLVTHHDSPVPFAACRHCDGLWFTREAIDAGGTPQLPPVGTRRSRTTPAAERACPQCMVTLHAEPVDEVVIDICPTCGGVWLDVGEYRAARRRSVRQRLARDLPSVGQPASRVTEFVLRLLDVIGELLGPEPAPVDPRDIVPRSRRNR
jgi:Zn-finger nucleic acid-binding protein